MLISFKKVITLCHLALTEVAINAALNLEYTLNADCVAVKAVIIEPVY